MSAGQASIQQQGTTTNIHQSSQNAAINWQQFNIQSHETVNFHQPNREAITLNRVLGNERSLIEGAMNANGNVFISNPNGVLIGNGASINVGGLVATTHKISDADLMNGKLQFSGNGNGKVENLGNIKVPKGGLVALVAPVVKNSGQITASEGAVLLASAEAFRLSLPNDNFSYTLTRGTLQGLVDNGGAILADGGRVVLTAKGVSEVKKSVVKHSGTIQANTVRKTNGVVELLGDLDNSELHFSGSITAEAPNGGDGGFVETSAAKVKIADSAKVSTQAKSGKTGNWVIDPKDFTVAASGGDITGRQVTESLKTSNVELKSRDGAKEGKGDVIVNDDIAWTKNTLTLNADNDIHINANLNGSGTAKLALKYGQATTGGGTADYYLEDRVPVHLRTVKINLPAGKNFSLQKGNAGRTLVSTVIHQMPEIVTKNNTTSTSVFSDQHIAFGADIDISHTAEKIGFQGWELPERSRVHGLGHKVTGLTLKNVSYAALFRSLVDGELRNLAVTGVELNLRGGGAGVVHSVNGGYLTGIYTSGEIRGDNSDTTGGLIGYLTADKGSSRIYQSAAAVDINRAANVGGLIGSVNGGQNTFIEQSYATGDITNAGGSAGGLIGSSFGSYIQGSYATGRVHGKDYPKGGLIGASDGDEIQDSYATGNVQETGSHSAGGLIGNMYRSQLLRTYATGRVLGGTATGGLVGQMRSGIIQDSYAQGDVSARSIVGGLIGYLYSNSETNRKIIANSYATGRVSLQVGYTSKDVGGLYGAMEKPQKDKPSVVTITNSYFNTDTTGMTDREGENFGRSTAEMKKKATFKGWDFDNVWQMEEGEYPRLVPAAEKQAIRDRIERERLAKEEERRRQQAEAQAAEDRKYEAAQDLYIRAKAAQALAKARGKNGVSEREALNRSIREKVAAAEAAINQLADSPRKTELLNKLREVQEVDFAALDRAEREKQNQAERERQAEENRKYEAAQALYAKAQKAQERARDLGSKQENLRVALNRIVRESVQKAEEAINQLADSPRKTALLNELRKIKEVDFAALDRAEREKQNQAERERQAEENRKYEAADELYRKARGAQKVAEVRGKNDVNQREALNRRIRERVAEAEAAINQLADSPRKTELLNKLREVKEVDFAALDRAEREKQNQAERERQAEENRKYEAAQALYAKAQKAQERARDLGSKQENLRVALNRIVRESVQKAEEAINQLADSPRKTALLNELRKIKEVDYAEIDRKARERQEQDRIEKEKQKELISKTYGHIKVLLYKAKEERTFIEVRLKAALQYDDEIPTKKQLNARLIAYKDQILEELEKLPLEKQVGLLEELNAITLVERPSQEVIEEAYERKQREKNRKLLEKQLDKVSMEYSKLAQDCRINTSICEVGYGNFEMSITKGLNLASRETDPQEKQKWENLFKSYSVKIETGIDFETLRTMYINKEDISQLRDHIKFYSQEELESMRLDDLRGYYGILLRSGIYTKSKEINNRFKKAIDRNLIEYQKKIEPLNNKATFKAIFSKKGLSVSLKTLVNIADVTANTVTWGSTAKISSNSKFITYAAKLGESDTIKRILDTTSSVLDGSTKDILRNILFGAVNAKADKFPNLDIENTSEIFEAFSKLGLALASGEFNGDVDSKIAVGGMIAELVSLSTIGTSSVISKIGSVWADSWQNGRDLSNYADEIYAELSKEIDRNFDQQLKKLSKKQIIETVIYNQDSRYDAVLDDLYRKNFGE